jgi:predicted nicotinamide N-methyase
MGVGYLVLPRGSSAGLREPAAARRFALLHVEADAEVWAVR